MSCLLSCALLTVLARWVSTTRANYPANAMAAAHVHLFLFRSEQQASLWDGWWAPRREERRAQAESSLLDRQARSSALIGRRRILTSFFDFRVALKIALHSAGAITGTVGSPMPVGFSSLATRCTSIGGASFIRIIW